MARSKLRESPTFRRTDILILSSTFRLGTRSPKGLLQPLGLLQACRQSSAADRTIPHIGAPSGSGDVSSDNALDWKDLETLDYHRPALESCDHLRGYASMESLRDIQGDIMSPKRGDLGLQQLEPELAKLGEDDALLINTLSRANIKFSHLAISHAAQE